MSLDKVKLAFYDSGIGGISVLREFLNYFKSLSVPASSPELTKMEDAIELEIHYIADSARAPYGARSLDDIRRYVYEFSDFVDNLGVNYFISACNTSSNLFEDLDFSSYKFETFNLFSALNLYLKEYSPNFKAGTSLYYLATAANINSQRYKDLAFNVIPVACPKLVPLIEKFKLDEARAILENEYLMKAFAGTGGHLEEAILVLGCTHYALIKHLLGVYKIIDPAELILKQFLNVFNPSYIRKISLNTYSTGESSALIVSTRELTVSSDK